MLHKNELKIEGLVVALNEQVFRNLVSEILPSHATDLQVLVWLELYHACVKDLVELRRHVI